MIRFTSLLTALDGAAVCIFGVVLSAAFCDIRWTARKRWFLVLSTVLMLGLQAVFYFGGGYNAAQSAYPLITHLPLVLVLYGLSGQGLWALVSVLTAFSCCQLRRWLALVLCLPFPGSVLALDIAQLLLTFPILLVLLHFAAPSVRSLAGWPRSLQLQFGILPALCYGYDYLTQVYTNLLADGNPAAVEFMFFVTCASYLVFLLRLTRQQRESWELEQARNSLNLQVRQAVREIEALRQSQRTASTYRHDLRHHMQYLAACLENGRTDQAQEYIHSVCSGIEASRVTLYCENEAANLILSAFAGRAKAADIGFRAEASIPQSLPLPETDLCVLLSNALENALHACQEQKALGRAADIALSAYQKNGRLFLQLTNSCGPDVAFVQGLPVTDRPGHGLGVRSICTIVEQHGGLSSFSAQNGRFTLRVAL